MSGIVVLRWLEIDKPSAHMNLSIVFQYLLAHMILWIVFQYLFDFIDVGKVVRPGSYRLVNLLSVLSC